MIIILIYNYEYNLSSDINLSARTYPLAYHSDNADVNTNSRTFLTSHSVSNSTYSHISLSAHNRTVRLLILLQIIRLNSHYNHTTHIDTLMINAYLCTSTSRA